MKNFVLLFVLVSLLFDSYSQSGDIKTKKFVSQDSFLIIDIDSNVSKIEFPKVQPDGPYLFIMDGLNDIKKITMFGNIAILILDNGEEIPTKISRHGFIEGIKYYIITLMGVQFGIPENNDKLLLYDKKNNELRQVIKIIII